MLVDASVVGRSSGGAPARDRAAQRPRSAARLARGARPDRREAVSRIEGDQQFSFKHGLIREVAYELLPRAHARAARGGRALPRASRPPSVGETTRRSRATGATPASRSARSTTFRAGRPGGARLGEGPAPSTLYREALELMPEDDDRRRGSRRRSRRRQALVHLVQADSSAPAADAARSGRRSAGSRSGVTSPAISWISSTCVCRAAARGRGRSPRWARRRRRTFGVPSVPTTTWLCSQTISGY